MIKVLTSLRLTLLSLGALILLTIPGTLFPQGLSQEMYLDRLGPFWGGLIWTTGYHQFFTSLWFLIPLGLFTLNLGACTLNRLVKQFKTKKPFFGPDVLHVGILLLIAGSLASYQMRSEVALDLGPGDELPFSQGGPTVLIREVKYETYDGKRPKDWITQVEIIPSGATQGVLQDIKVNQPLELQGIGLYQQGYQERVAAVFQGPDGRLTALAEGTERKIGNTTIKFAALMEKKDKPGTLGAGLLVNEAPLVLEPGESLSEVTLARLGPTGFTTLKAASDPGFFWVLGAFGLIGIGFGMIAIRKIKEA